MGSCCYPSLHQFLHQLIPVAYRTAVCDGGSQSQPVASISYVVTVAIGRACFGPKLLNGCLRLPEQSSPIHAALGRVLHARHAVLPVMWWLFVTSAQGVALIVSRALACQLAAPGGLQGGAGLFQAGGAILGGLAGVAGRPVTLVLGLCLRCVSAPRRQCGSAQQYSQST